MKNLAILITAICLMMALNVQANNFSNQPVENTHISPADIAADMNLLTIKSEIDANTRGYFMTGSFTVLKTPTGRDRDVARTTDISFRNSVIQSKNNYIQANPQAVRNDNNSKNEFRIYVPHDNGSQGKIDARNIKVNWKTGSLEVVDKLDNVSVIYQEHTILIIGTMEKNGYTIGASLAISKEARLL